LRQHVMKRGKAEAILATDPIWNRFDPEREAIVDLLKKRGKKRRKKPPVPLFIENEPPEAIAPERQILVANEVAKPWSDYAHVNHRREPHNPERLGQFPPRIEDVLVQHKLKQGGYEYGYIMKETPTQFIVMSQNGMIYVSKNKLYPVLDGKDVIRIFLAEMAPRKRPKPGAYAEPADVDAPALDQMFEDEIIERNERIKQRASAPLPETDSEPEEEEFLDLTAEEDDTDPVDLRQRAYDEAIERRASDYLAQMALEKDAELRGYASDSGETVASGYESEASDWTNKMERRIGDFRGELEAIQEDEDSEGEPLLPLVDPDWPKTPPPRGKRSIIEPTKAEFEDEHGNWSLTMFGVAFAFLMIASYMD